MTKIYIAFLSKPYGEPGWPFANFDAKARSEELLALIHAFCPQVELIGRELVTTTEEALQLENALKSTSYEEIAGVCLILLSSINFPLQPILTTGHRFLVLNDLFGGDLAAFEAKQIANDRRLPAVVISSSNINDWKCTIDILINLYKIRNKRLLLIENHKIVDDQSHKWRECYVSYLCAVKNTFGINIIEYPLKKLVNIYDNISNISAIKIANLWVEKAISINCLEEEVLKAARLYLAMRQIMEKESASAITIDCLSFVPRGLLPAYPCLAYAQLAADGYIGTCEADVEAAITQLVGQAITDQPGFVSDPVLDLGTETIIYSHCMCPIRIFSDLQFTYALRTHAEDDKGVAIEVQLPPNRIITTIKLNVLAKAIAIHRAISLGNVSGDRACRTKYAASANVRAIFDNWDYNTFGWHRVTFWGDWFDEFMTAARFLQLRCVIEDQNLFEMRRYDSNAPHPKR